MGNLFTKKIIVVASVVLTVVLGAVILAFATGNTHLPSLDDPKGIFYERLDENGKVIYSITNEELYEQIKSNNGLQQLLMNVDTLLLTEYLDAVSNEEIQNRIKKLKYGTDDFDKIAELDDETTARLEAEYERSMLLAGYSGKEDEYAMLLIAREKYALEKLIDKITETEVATEFIQKHFEDMQAIRIRFTSLEDAKAVLQKYNLTEFNGESLRKYVGFIYKDETMLDIEDEIVDAHIGVEVFFFDESGNILNLDDETIYTIGANDIYTDEDEATFRLDSEGNLIDNASTIIIQKEHLFERPEEAQTYYNENAQYFYMTKTDAYDMDEDIIINDSEGNLAFILKANGDLFDKEDVDVTDTSELEFNKEFKEIKDVTTFTSNNTIELSDVEVLNYYVEMYNYVYGLFRDLLPTDTTIEDLITLDNDYLKFNFDEETAISANLATYEFKTISMLNDKLYSLTPQSVTTGSSTYYYMVYKLDEPTKLNLGALVLDIVEDRIVLPENIVESIVLPTKGEYDATISWTSADRNTISNTGVVTTPSVPTKVDLSYTIKVLGETRTGKITVNILPEGENSSVEENTEEVATLKSLLNNDSLYNKLATKLAENKVYGSNGSTNITKELYELRDSLGFTIYDYYLALDYKQVNTAYETTNRGHKTLVATLDKTLTSEESVEITADDFFEYALLKNPAIYTLYASQNKELLYSEYFVETFGTQTNLKRNDSLKMDEMYDAIAYAKQYYTYIKSLYEQYGMNYPYNNFSDYAYSQYGTKTEFALLQYFVTRELQPYMINAVIEQYKVIEQVYEIVEDNYENYFSLDVIHLLIFIDFDEDGSPDKYNEYIDDLTPEKLDDYNTLLASLEIAINEFDGTFTELVTAYNKATREDTTWGVFKQNGILILTEDLNSTDSEDQNVKHSRTYSGEHGTKDVFAEEFTEALISLYKEYQLPQNKDLDSLVSDLVTTDFGLHIIEVEQGDEFDRLSAKFTTEDADGKNYSADIFNDSEKPTLKQLELYTLYKFYSMVYDLTDADIESKFDIEIPNIPASVNKAIEFYFDYLLSEFYVLGVVNVNLAELLVSGEFKADNYANLTNTQLMSKLDEVKTAYFEAILGKYFD
jgi:hypothetical protein